MHISESSPFILMVGSELIIPTRIKIGQMRGGTAEIPLQIIEKSANVYHFIDENSPDEGELVLTVPLAAVKVSGTVTVNQVDLTAGTANAYLK